RLRFLGSKQLSALGSLFFLAVWHGLHPGYLFTFGMEFLDMEAERHLRVFAPAWLYWSRVSFVGFWLSLGLIVLANVVHLLFRSAHRPATITKVVAEPMPIPDELPSTDGEGRKRRASVLEEADALAMTAAKLTELIGDVSASTATE
ncbi:hypothetical protein SYNPS1DRAFT_21293, partial [Syncephalis pseudoplumigaleata]